MASRILLFVLIAAAQTAAAQTLPLAATENARQPDRSKHVEITLELRSVALSDRGIEWLRTHKDLSLPAMSCCATLNQQQIDLLIDLAKGDRRSSINPLRTLRLPDGKRGKLGISDPEISDMVQATLSEDRKTVELRLLWATDADGSERFPPMTAEVPLGSHLLIHMSLCAHQLHVPLLTRFFDWLDKREPTMGVYFEYSQVFLLITPRIALPQAQQEKAVVQ
jgi:hypothetical protein